MRVDVARPPRLPLLVVGGLLGLVGHACAPAAPGDARVSATMLEARLLAPCCWVQTLDVHESDVASELRAEIEQRVHAGETAESIEADFAARFGERVRAVPQGTVDPTRIVPMLGVLYLLGSLGAIVLFARNKRRAAGSANDVARAGLPTAEATGIDRRDDLDRRVDEELEKLDDA